MFGLDTNVILIMALAAVAFGGVVFAFMYTSIESEANQARRMSSIQDRDQVKASKAAARVADVAKRRKTIQDSLKELEEKQKAKHNRKLTLKDLLPQAGLKITVQQFYMLSILFGCAAAIITFFSSLNILAALGTLFVATLGVPRWFIGYLRKRRFKAFLEEFPNAVDVIVRGVRAGLPLNDCLGIISREAKEPVAGEFVKIVEAQKMGMGAGDAVGKLYRNVPISETNFFGIVIAIQEQAGGNLSEALGNLSAVLRERKKMVGKIKAYSAEAKASAGIIGALPPIVAFLIFLTTPDYITILFTHPTGHIILGCSAVWMAIGVMVMKNMINFDI